MVPTLRQGNFSCEAIFRYLIFVLSFRDFDWFKTIHGIFDGKIFVLLLHRMCSTKCHIEDIELS